MNNPTQTEMRVKRTRLDAIVSTYNSAVNAQAQNEAIGLWENRAAKIIIVGNRTPPAIDGKQETSGFILVPTRDQDPSLVEALDYYHKRGNPDEYVVVCAPNVSIREDNSDVFDFVYSAKMMRAWAGFIKLPSTSPDQSPDAFIVSGYVLDFLRKDIPGTITMATDAWSKWMHNWFSKKLSPNRYFDASRVGIVSGLSNAGAATPIPAISSPPTAIPAPANTSAPLPALKAVEAHKSPVPEPIVVQEGPKRRRGRPPGSKNKVAA